MYGLPQNFDGRFLEGSALELICFAQFQIYLHFDNKVSIRIESALLHEEQEGSRRRYSEMPVLESNLMVLLGRYVVSASGNEAGTLTLQFDNGHKLHCLDDSKQYESYTITYSEGEIIV